MATRSLAFPLGVVVASSAPPRNDDTTAAADALETRALTGDEAAWDELFRRHNRRVVLSLMARGVRPDVARDLAQDAWMRIIEQQRRGRLRLLRLPGLIVKQALFLARDQARRGEAGLRRIELEKCAGETADPEPYLFARSLIARARVVLAGCGQSHQQVFRAIYGQPGVSASEVAASTGLSVQRVRQIVCEVRKKLRAALTEGEEIARKTQGEKER